MDTKASLRLALLLSIALGVTGLLSPQIGLGLDGQWSEIGAGSASGSGVSNTTVEAIRPDIAVGPNGEIVLTWSDKSGGNTEIFVKEWRDGAWQEIGTNSATGGGISNNAGSSEFPSVAVGSNGVIYVAWEDGSNGNKEIYVRRYDEGVWSEIGGSASKGGISNTSGDSKNPSLGLGPEDLPYIAWEEIISGSDSEIYVRRWNANTWGEVGAGGASGGGISNNSGDSTLPSLVVNEGGDVFVGWADKSGGDTEIYARYFAGSMWAELGTGAATGSGISDNDGISRNVDLALGGDGSVFAVWSDDSTGNFEIYIQRWNGSWSEVGAGSAAGGGISQNVRHSHAPRLEVDPGGRPSVVWYQTTAADAEIFLRRWNGASWEELGGSGSGDGLSNNTSASSHPALTAFGQRLFVAWNDNGPGPYSIYALQWVGEEEPENTPTPTVTVTTTTTPTNTSTTTPTTTVTATTTPQTTSTATATGTVTFTPTATSTPQAGLTPTSTATGFPTPTATRPWLALPFVIYEEPPTPTPTSTPTATLVPSSTPTATLIPTNTPTRTPIPPTSTATLPAPTATATRQQNCHPSYPTVCIPPPPPDLDCKDIPYRNFVVLPPDPHRFDSDKDGRGCES